MKKYDVIIIGGGAAGLSAAATATARGRSVAVLDMGANPGRRVAASGGGRCNFTNADVGPARYFGNNPDFVRGAIARVTPNDMLDWMAAHGLGVVEKSPGQYFCADGADAVVSALRDDARAADIFTECMVHDVIRNDTGFNVICDGARFAATHIIVATGGMSFATLGVSDVGYRIARSFGHKIVPVRPALCAIVTSVLPNTWAGISMPAEIAGGARRVCGDILFTHFGIGGPVVYSASVASSDCDLRVNLMPGIDLLAILRNAKRTNGRKSVSTILAAYMPAQIARYFAPMPGNIADVRDAELAKIVNNIIDISIPAGKWRHYGMSTAEVTYGGIATDQISSKTMESKLCPGLFFAGEVMDITGDLGGFNLHWAWASGRVAGTNA